MRVAPWVKPIGVSSRTYGPHNTWEALVVYGGRKLRPGVRDWLCAMPARGGGDLTGRKPIAFCAFLFDQLGMIPGDTLDDLYPGTGIVTTTWTNLSRRPSATHPPRRFHRIPLLPIALEASLGPNGDASFVDLSDASQPGLDDASSPSPRGDTPRGRS